MFGKSEQHSMLAAKSHQQLQQAPGIYGLIVNFPDRVASTKFQSDRQRCFCPIQS
ncbi:hypothetical protein BURPS1710A_2488 [Burkholderia pseudomallei 1710a]|uniref:Uncharacterized protein n=1 Tax=Burkholderia pseudomallei 1710a TaxID=320371 RepID=A0A0E1WDA9_BURPE|nr:hypothetical protein BURPS1710A_2488 [Burkholderia pseudomallei 1710a]